MMKTLGSLVICEKCGRKILIERGLFGTNHTSSIWVYCWDCLPPEKQKKAIEFYDFNEDDLEPKKQLIVESKE